MAAKLATSKPRSPARRRVVRLGIWAAVLLLVFGVLLPQVIDYEAVWDALAGLSLPEVLVLLLLAAAKILTEGIVYSALLPNTGVLKATRAWLIVWGGTQFLPPPADSVVFYAVARSNSTPAKPALAGSLLTFLYPTVGRLALPFLAIVAVAVFAAFGPDDLALVIVIPLISAVLITVGVVVVRSERTARRAGDLLSVLLQAAVRQINRVVRSREVAGPQGSFAPAARPGPLAVLHVGAADPDRDRRHEPLAEGERHSVGRRARRVQQAGAARTCARVVTTTRPDCTLVFGSQGPAGSLLAPKTSGSLVQVSDRNEADDEQHDAA